MKEALTPTDKLRRALRIAHLTAAQKKTLQKMFDAGCEQDPSIDHVVWFNGHCIAIKPDGKTDEL